MSLSIKTIFVNLALVGLVTSVASAAPVAYWRMDDSSGNASLADATGNYAISTQQLASSGSTSNIAPNPLPNPDSVYNSASTAALTGGAWRQGGISSSPFQLKRNADFTFEGWLKGDPAAGTWQIIGGTLKLDSAERHGWAGWMLSARNNTLHGFDLIVYDESSTLGYHNVQYTTAALADGKAHHFALVWDGNATGGTIKFYMDGQALTENGSGSTSVAWAVQDSSLSDEFIVGGRNLFGSPSNVYAGTMDELRFSDAALNPNEFLNAVPEPATMGMLAVGGVLGLIRKRK